MSLYDLIAILKGKMDHLHQMLKIKETEYNLSLNVLMTNVKMSKCYVKMSYCHTLYVDVPVVTFQKPFLI